LSVKLSLCAGFFAFEGIAVAAGTFVAPRSSLIAAIVIGISFVTMSILFLHYRWFLRLFDALGYTKISITSESDLEAYWARNDKFLTEFTPRIANERPKFRARIREALVSGTALQTLQIV
jgi:hypothetical protein